MTVASALLVTGGAGFIGSAVIRRALAGNGDRRVVNVDKLTYAASPDSLASVASAPGYRFERCDIADRAAMAAIFARHRPSVVLHLAAETHVDRSIDGPAQFLATNVAGTGALLEVALEYWRAGEPGGGAAFRFIHVSTDEVFGSLGPSGRFDQSSPYRPRSPYAASKAASDHLVRAWGHTYGFPAIVSNCSNNFGPWQFPEKLIPLIATRALLGHELPVYGDGGHIRDWLHVDDHAEALLLIAARGVLGETYLVGGSCERSNLAVVERICDRLDRTLGPLPTGAGRRSLIRFVADRPGHDRRYAIDSSALADQLGWRARRPFDAALDETVDWYVAHRDWWRRLRAERYDGGRLGLVAEGARG